MKRTIGGKCRTISTLPTAEDQQAFEEFLTHYGTLKSLSDGSIKKYSAGVSQILGWIAEENATVKTLTENKILSIINKLQKCSWSEATREDYWTRFVNFYKWVNRRGYELDEAVKLILIGDQYKEGKYQYKIDKKRTRKRPIFSPEEVLHLINVEPNLCYKTLYAVAFESGMRTGELFSLRRKDVIPTKLGGMDVFMRESKTIKRKIPLVSFSVNYLRKWLDSTQGEPTEPLWKNTYGEELTQFASNKHLKSLTKEAKIDKSPVSLKTFRHSRATDLAGKGLTEFEMCKFFGWKIGSDMPRTYIREQQLDVELKLRKVAGQEEDTKPKPTGVLCLHCEHSNSLTAKYCDICNMPLDREEFENIKANVNVVKMKEMLKGLIKQQQAEVVKQVISEIRAGKELS